MDLRPSTPTTDRKRLSGEPGEFPPARCFVRPRAWPENDLPRPPASPAKLASDKCDGIRGAACCSGARARLEASRSHGRGVLAARGLAMLGGFPITPPQPSGAKSVSGL